ncbi:hypothetical protein [Viridibacterium curvum]|uniref:hypothetical protein n=1 Tax=Viridibacterium curvum TaxID=1101404 RepID=UPI0031EA034E
MADTIRDGGSYFMLLAATNGDQFQLNLPVHRDQNFNRLGWHEPRVIYSGQSSTLSWLEAAELASQLSALTHAPILEGGVDRAKECIAIMLNRGQDSA